jgi:hypothetical protein
VTTTAAAAESWAIPIPASVKLAWAATTRDTAAEPSSPDPPIGRKHARESPAQQGPTGSEPSHHGDRGVGNGTARNKQAPLTTSAGRCAAARKSSAARFRSDSSRSRRDTRARAVRSIPGSPRPRPRARGQRGSRAHQDHVEATADATVTPAANPSSPSSRFTAFTSTRPRALRGRCAPRVMTDRDCRGHADPDSRPRAAPRVGGRLRRRQARARTRARADQQRRTRADDGPRRATSTATPPRYGTGRACTFSGPGSSTRPRRSRSNPRRRRDHGYREGGDQGHTSSSWVTPRCTASRPSR